MLKPLHKIYLLLILIAFVLTGITVLVVYQHITPYKFSLKHGSLNNKMDFWRHDFYDLDKNGLEEKLVFANNFQNQEYYIKIYRDYKGSLIDQFNFQTPIKKNSPAYYDLNGDGVDEVFIFSNDNDSLYLSVIDIQKPGFLIKEKAILSSSPERAQTKWDIGSLHPCFSDLDNNGETELVFAVNSGYSHLPRCVCALELNTVRVIRRFDHHLGFVIPYILDLDGDGKKEIALQNYASNNFPPGVFLSDAYSWLVLLDYQFNLLREPVQMGEKFSRFTLSKFKINEKSYFLAATNKFPTSHWYLIGSNGDIIKKQEHRFTFYNYRINYSTDFPEIIISAANGKILFMNQQLQIIRQFRAPIDSRGTIAVVRDVLKDRMPEILFTANKGLYLLDYQGNTLAFYPTESGITNAPLFLIPRRNSHTPLILLDTKKSLMEFQIIPNLLYTKLFLVSPGIFLVFFILLLFAHTFYNKLHQYVSYFLFSLRASEHAIILLDHRGKVLSVNNRVTNFLNLDNPIKPKSYFNDSLNRHLEVVQIIQECMQTGQQVRRQFDFEDAQKSFIGEITVTPFRSLFNFINAYLVEIKDSTRQVMLERQQNWQRNIRKIVHDIKTPLAGIQLKLQTLYMDLQEKQDIIDPEMLNSLETAHSELLRIRNITRSFLKFSDLEQINPVELQPEEFIKQCLAPFKMYVNEQLKIGFRVLSSLPERVYWDERQIEILLHTIVENSLDALKGKGEITIEMKSLPHSEDTDTPAIEIRISDNGPGIPKEHQEKIFEPHFSTKREGSGLGLSFAKLIVQQHNGKISFSSVPTSGTIFVITLPATVSS